MKKLRVTVDGKGYDVLVEILEEGGTPAPAGRPAVHPPHVEPAHVSAPPAAAATPAPASGAPGDVPSPLAGKVVSVDVQPGQKVQAGAQLLTLEAMKMNTYVFAPGAGTVQEILAAPGDAVAEGQVLVKMS